MLAFLSMGACGGGSGNEGNGANPPPVTPTIVPGNRTPTPGATPTPNGGGADEEIVAEVGSGVSADTRRTENYEITVVMGQFAPLDERTSAKSNYSISTFGTE